jgi:hypothetical protein
MSSLTSYGRQYMVESVFGKTKAVASVYYIAALKAPPNSSSTGSNIVEPNAADYMRLEIVNNSSNFFSAGIGRVYNEQELRWDAAVSDWGWITHWALCDSLEGGRAILFNQLSKKVLIEAGDILVVEGAGLSIGVLG